jgi:hypothetical protein
MYIDFYCFRFVFYLGCSLPEEWLDCWDLAEWSRQAALKLHRNVQSEQHWSHESLEYHVSWIQRPLQVGTGPHWPDCVYWRHQPSGLDGSLSDNLFVSIFSIVFPAAPCGWHGVLQDTWCVACISFVHQEDREVSCETVVQHFNPVILLICLL